MQLFNRGRASKLDERLHKLDKYCDGVNTKKTQRNESLTNDQAGSTNSKIGTQVYRNPAELVNQRVEDRPKNVLLNKRVRTSVAETRVCFLYDLEHHINCFVTSLAWYSHLEFNIL